jgi:phosphatidylglycerol:prolipoprotein diacylglycerol transferase
MAIVFPNINPAIIEFGALKVTWYSLAYIVGIILGYYYVLWLNDKRKNRLSRKVIEDSISYIIIGIIIGGRVGYVIFYKPYYYLSNPIQILKTWEGGMSFHGALIGVLIALILYCRKNKISFLYFVDYIVCAGPIGLFFGRIANFINGELYGRVSNVSWAVLFPHGGMLPRHPSQLYEAVLEGLVLFLVLLIVFTKTKLKELYGSIGALFLILYALFRFFVEYFREPDYHLGFVFYNFSMGQLLSLIMLIIGVSIFIMLARRFNKNG